jgi:hypothetical protein
MVVVMKLPADGPEWHELLRNQHGAVSRTQALAMGISRASIQTHLRAGRWKTAIPGIYVTFSGPLPALTVWWIALLHAGVGAVLSHRTAGALWGLVSDAPLYPIHVTVPRTRGVRSRPELVVHRSV